jgi:hypothetical protein
MAGHHNARGSRVLPFMQYILLFFIGMNRSLQMAEEPCHPLPGHPFKERRTPKKLFQMFHFFSFRCRYNRIPLFLIVYSGYQVSRRHDPAFGNFMITSGKEDFLWKICFVFNVNRHPAAQDAADLPAYAARQRKPHSVRTASPMP